MESPQIGYIVSLTVLAIIVLGLGIYFLRRIILNDTDRKHFHQALSAISTAYIEAQEKKKGVEAKRRVALERATTVHEGTLRKLNDDQADKAKELLENPDALSAALVDTGKPKK